MKRFPNLPFAPAKFPFFYGWVCLFAGTIGMLSSIPGQTMGVSVFTDHLIEHLNLSRDAISICYLIGTISSSLILTHGGRLYDKTGARFTAIVAATILSISIFTFSYSPNIIGFLSDQLHLPSFGASFAVTTLLFFLIRFSGQGIMTIASKNMIMKWFDAKRGLTNGMMSVMMSLGFSFAPLFLAGLINSYQWNGAYQVLAMMTVGFGIFALIFFRDNPEECGLVLDGKTTKERKRGKENIVANKQFTLEEARKTWTFWIYALAVSFNAFFITGFTFHVVSIFESFGQSEEKAISIFIPISIISVTFSIAGNLLSDHIKMEKILRVYLIGCALGGLNLAFLGYEIGYYGFILGIGIMSGIFTVLISVVWPKYFGRQYLGAISGQVMSIVVFASAIAPIAFSSVFSLTNSYAIIGLISSGLAIAILGFSHKAKNPQG